MDEQQVVEEAVHFPTPQPPPDWSANATDTAPLPAGTAAHASHHRYNMYQSVERVKILVRDQVRQAPDRWHGLGRMEGESNVEWSRRLHVGHAQAQLESNILVHYLLFDDEPGLWASLTEAIRRGLQHQKVIRRAFPLKAAIGHRTNPIDVDAIESEDSEIEFV